MREIARIRNEHSVEIMKLRKNLEQKLKSDSYSTNQKSIPTSGSNQNDKAVLKSKENFKLIAVQNENSLILFKLKIPTERVQQTRPNSFKIGIIMLIKNTLFRGCLV